MFSLHNVALLGVVAALLLLERFSPWRRDKAPIKERWASNIGLMLVGAITTGILLSSDLSAIAADMPAGRLRDQSLPLWVETLLVVLLLDCWRYWEHRVFHEWPLLWRVHLVHHSDTALDVTTAERHHPFEAVLAVFTGTLLLFAFGYSAQALGAYLLLATLASFYTHAGVRLPDKLDQVLRLLFVTPSVHAVHHSDLQTETDSNYGTLLTIWDRLFGTYVDPSHARIPHFGLEYFHRPEDAGLGAVLLQPFDYRQRPDFYPARATSPTAVAEGAQVPLNPQWRLALLRLGIGLALCALVLWPTVLSLLQVWAGSETYQYAWWIVPMALYVLCWHQRDRILALTPAADYAGLWFIVPAVALWCVGFVAEIQLAQHLALVLVLQGVVLSTLGRGIYCTLFPVFAMLFLMVPSGDLLQLPLRALTVKWIEGFALVFDIPHSIEGYVTYIGDLRYVVVDACSGLTYVLMGGFLGYCFGVLLFHSLWRVLGLALAGAALGVMTNAFRVWLILAIDWVNQSQMSLDEHADVQWLALLASLGVLLYLASRLADGRAGEAAPVVAQPEAGRPGRPLAPVLAFVLVLAVLGPVQLAARSAAAIGDSAVEDLIVRYPGSYRLQDTADTQRTLVIPFSGRFDAVLVEPQQRYGRIIEHGMYPEDLAVWRHAGTAGYRDCVDGHCIDFVHKIFRRKSSDQVRHAVYAYFLGTDVTNSQLDYRLGGGLRKLTGDSAAAGVLGFRISGELPQVGELADVFFLIRGEMARSHAQPAYAQSGI